jgi:hypothetical protein
MTLHFFFSQTNKFVLSSQQWRAYFFGKLLCCHVIFQIVSQKNKQKSFQEFVVDLYCVSIVTVATQLTNKTTPLLSYQKKKSDSIIFTSRRVKTIFYLASKFCVISDVEKMSKKHSFDVLLKLILFLDIFKCRCLLLIMLISFLIIKIMIS